MADDQSIKERNALPAAPAVADPLGSSVAGRWSLACLERLLVLLLAASFTLPVLLGSALWFTRDKSSFTLWLRNGSLSGQQIRPQEVPLSRAAVLSGRYQSTLAENYNVRFTGRELMIRCINEVYLRLLRTSSASVLVGPHFSLLETAYAEEYCLARHDADAFRTLADDLRRLQDFCDARGTAFALVITPSKAAIYPESLPACWRERYQPGARDYDLLLPLLRARDIRFVDGHRLAAEMKPAARVPLFPLGGVHWGATTGLAATDALLELLAGQGLNVQPIRYADTRLSWQPAGEDADMASLLNTVETLRYPVSVVTVAPQEPTGGERPTAVFIGGSFLWKILYPLAASRQFSEMEYYFYYKEDKFSAVRGEVHLVAAPAPELDFPRDVFAADALVLELNEQTIYGQRHLTAFLQDALAVLPDPHAPRVPFHYESHIEYQWGDTLSFRQGFGHVINSAATANFSLPGKGSFTEGPLASIELYAPTPEKDMVLEAKCSGFTVKGRLPRQAVGISVNGHPVGEWSWTTLKPARREMVIPKEFLAGGKVKLEFRVDHPASPAEFGVGPDTRKLGMFIESLQLHAVGE